MTAMEAINYLQVIDPGKNGWENQSSTLTWAGPFGSGEEVTIRWVLYKNGYPIACMKNKEKLGIKSI